MFTCVASSGHASFHFITSIPVLARHQACQIYWRNLGCTLSGSNSIIHWHINLEHCAQSNNVHFCLAQPLSDTVLASCLPLEPGYKANAVPHHCDVMIDDNSEIKLISMNNVFFCGAEIFILGHRYS